MKQNNRIAELSVENTRLIFCNFSGRKEKYNAEGKRRFGVVIPDRLLEKATQAGWRIKTLDPQQPNGKPTKFIDVKVNYNSKRPPKIYRITSDKKILLTEENVGELDNVIVKSADVVLNPYVYDKDDGSGKGVSAYLDVMYIIYDEDVFASKYADKEVIEAQEAETLFENDDAPF